VRELSVREILVWTLGAAVLFAGLMIARTPQMYNDSFQYLSVIGNLLSDHGVATDLVHFDVERAHGVIPAPLTTFPPGYPMVAALLAVLSLAPPTAGAVVTVAAMAISVMLLGLCARALGLSRVVARLVLFGYVANANTLFLASSLLSEPLFTALVMAGVLCLIHGMKASGRTAVAWSIGAGFAVGLSYWVRYAGLLFSAGVLFALGAAVLLHRTRDWFQRLAATAIPAGGLMAVGFVRNVTLTGTWKGGNTKVARHGVAGVVKETVKSFWHLFGGDAVGLAVRVSQLLALIALALLFVAWRSRPRREAALLLAIAAVYAAAMFYLGVRSDISYGTRMFFPILPLLLLLLGCFLEPLAAAPRRTLLAAGAAGYALCGLLGVARAHPGVEVAVRDRLALPTASGEPLRDWLRAHLDRREAVLAADGQATGFVLGCPAVSLLESEYSDTDWTEEEVARTMDRFHVRYLILYPNPASSGAADLQQESHYLHGLIAGGDRPSPGAGLVLAARNADAIVLERAAARAGGPAIGPTILR
jgi:hypothetical protein